MNYELKVTDVTFEDLESILADGLMQSNYLWTIRNMNQANTYLQVQANSD